VCPHPGCNLPQDWDQAPEDTKYVCLLTSCLGSFHNSFSGDCIRISSQLMRIFASNSKVVESVILKLGLAGHTSSETSSTMNTFLITQLRRRWARCDPFFNCVLTLLRPLGAVQTSTLSVKRTPSPQGTTSPLVWLLVYVQDTLLCKGMELAICSEANGMYDWTQMNTEILIAVQVYQHGLYHHIRIERSHHPQCRYLIRYHLQMVGPPSPEDFR
jgi:hypothetical protein